MLALIASLTCVAQAAHAVDFSGMAISSMVTSSGVSGVRIELPVPGGEAIPVGSEPYLEFMVADLDPVTTATFVAYWDEGEESVPIDPANLVEASYWEITPTDHENGLGNYVRLYLEPAGLNSALNERAALIVIPGNVALVDLLVGLGSARLVTGAD
jgi:hypothetical protein